ncbi:oxidoreductase [Armatimonadota bacterium]|nr:oxidoreductase [Armatimonadota bacterium]
MSEQLSRRGFLRSATIMGAGALAIGVKAQSPNDKLNLGIIGVNHRGGDNLNGVQSQNIVALCDIDENYLNEAKQRFPNAKTFTDYRKMLEMKGLDGAVISTPDHHHAPATSLALHAGLHVYCEKPLTHTVQEARTVAQLAKRYRRVTQMGTQIHAENNYRRVVELIQSGAIGEVSEVHTWVQKIWAGSGKPSDTPPVPANLHWNEWLGPAAERPYHPSYLPATWRGFWDFGCGTIGDMACHHMDLPFWALGLRYPATISAEGPVVDSYVTPNWLTVHYEFPVSGRKKPIKLSWYDGERVPPILQEKGLPNWGGGNLFIGSKGMLLADYGQYKLLPEKDFVGYVPPAPTITNSIGHHNEWIQACKTGGVTTCNFDYSGALTEAVLLGNVAYRTGKTLEWDAKHLKVKNVPEAEAYLRTAYRSGWKV